MDTQWETLEVKKKEERVHWYEHLRERRQQERGSRHPSLRHKVAMKIVPLCSRRIRWHLQNMSGAEKSLWLWMAHPEDAGCIVYEQQLHLLPPYTKQHLMPVSTLMETSVMFSPVPAAPACSEGPQCRHLGHP